MLKKVYYSLILSIAFGLAANTTVAQTLPDNSVRTDQYGKVVNRIPLSAEARNGILVFESADQSFKYWLDSRVYFDAAFFPNNTINPIGNGADIRRARFAVKAVLGSNWYGEIDLDFAGSQVELKDAYFAYEGNSWNIKGGHFKEGFSMETTTTSRYVMFIERSLASKMSPSRHLGLQANFRGNKWLLITGIHARTIGDIEEYVPAQDNNKDFGIDDGYSLTGRFVYTPILKDDKMLHFGVGGSYRTPKTHLEVVDSYRYSTRSYTSINRKKYLDTDDIANVKNTTLFGLELAGSWKNLMFQSEYIRTDVTRNDDLSKIAIDGFYAQAGILLFGGKYNYNKNDGEFTQNTLGKDWGDLELAFRFDYMNANDFEAQVYGGSANGYLIGLNYYPIDNLKFMLNYAYLNHDRYANGKGKLHIYEDAQGNLIKDPLDQSIPEGKGGEDFGFISLRAIVSF